MSQATANLVSVIIPTYNRADLIGATLDSVLAQTYPHIEVLVADDGSTDDTAAVVAGYGERVTFLPLPHVGLPAAARNAAIARARGAYLAFLDSDDLWLPDKLARQVTALEAYPDAGLCGTDALVLREGEGEPRDRLLVPGAAASGRVLPRLLADNFLINSSVLLRRAVFDQAGPLSEEPLLRALEDYDLWLRCAALSEVVSLDAPLVIYRDSPHSIRGEQLPARAWEGRVRVMERIAAFLTDRHLLTPDLRELLGRRRADMLQGLIRAYRTAGNRSGARRAWLRLLAARPRTAVRIAAAALHRPRPTPPLRVSRATGGVKLHLGCGQIHLDGYVNIDYSPSEHTVQTISAADEYADITQLHFPVQSIDEVRLHHVFEHFDRPTALRLLITWYAWLREGGLLTLETPDFTRTAREVLRRGRVEEQQTLMRHLFGSHEAAWALHADGWYREKFTLVLTALGYRDITFIDTRWKDTFNLIVQAEKRAPFVFRTEQLAACERLLRLHLVDESAVELRMLETWLARLREGLPDGP